MAAVNVFTVWDYVIFILTLVFSLGIGIYYALSGGRQRTTSEYLVGNRKMTVLPVAISLMVSFESSIMMLGIPAEIYRFGIQFVMGSLGWLVANLLAAKMMVPLIHPLKITSAYEYLELRFKSHAVRLLGTALGMIGYVLYMGIVLFGPAIALEAVSGFPLYSSILVVATASIIYTAIGGIKAVIWTDVFQTLIMYSGMFSILIKGTMRVGGVAKTWEIAGQRGRLNFFNFDLDPTVRHTFWGLFVGSIVRGFSLVLNQSSVQRISSTAKLQDARRVMYIMAPLFFLTSSLAVVEGVVAYAYYDVIGCDPLQSKKIRDSNQIIPLMVMDIFEGLPGMPGLFLASLFSASLSTLSSGLSSLSALLWQDFVKPHTKPMTEFRATIIAKLSVVGFGLLAIAVAYLVSIIGGTLTQISATILSSVGAPLAGLFFLGCFCPWANAKGAMLSCIGSVGVLFWIVSGMKFSSGVKRAIPLPPAPMDGCFSNSLSNTSELFNSTIESQNMTMLMSTTTESVRTQINPEGIAILYSMSYLHLGLIGIFFVIIFGSLISFMTGYEKPEDSNPMFLVSLSDELLFFLPESIRKPLRFGYNYEKPKDFGEKSGLYETPTEAAIVVDEKKDYDGKSDTQESEELDYINHERLEKMNELNIGAADANDESLVPLTNQINSST